MSSQSTFGLTFYINRSKEKKNGECPVMMRISINGQKLAVQVQRFIKPAEWDAKKYQMIGRTKEARIFNDYLDAVKFKTLKKYNELLTAKDEVSPAMVRDALLGVNSDRPRMLFETWVEHNENLRKLIGKENSYTTYQKFVTTKNHFSDFLKEKYKQSDVSIKKIDHLMISKFSDYLKIEKGCGHNTTVKFLQNVKRLIIIWKNNGWLVADPFANIKLSLKDVQRPYLTEEELQRIVRFESSFDRLNRVRDFFLFACFTGLAYIDVKQLKKKHIEENESGMWIRTFRQKTEGRANIPLLEIPLRILNSYYQLEMLNDNDPVLPILSNQKLNAYLKELADLCGIEKQLTFHIARHTFATTVTMMNGVPIESVSKMLGHKRIITTQHYARIVDQKVGEDMNILAQKLNNRFAYKN